MALCSPFDNNYLAIGTAMANVKALVQIPRMLLNNAQICSPLSQVSEKFIQTISSELWVHFKVEIRSVYGIQLPMTNA